jgi:SNF2 family DNA or RNA helicase
VAHAELLGNRIVLTLEWNENEIIKLVPGARYSKIETGDKVWHLPLTYASMIAMRGVFGTHFTYGQELQDWTWNVRQVRIDPANAVREALTWDQDLENFDPRLYPFQRADVMFMDVSGNWLLGSEMGTGKTVSTLSWLHRLGPDALPALIVCPNNVKHHWRKRAAEFCPLVNVYVVEKGTVKGRKLLAAAKEDPKALVVINYEGVRSFSRSAPYGSVRLKKCRLCDKKFGEDIPTSRCEVHPKELNAFGFRTVLIDEIHVIGNAKAKWTRATWAVAHDPSVTRRGGLTGTPDNMTRLWNIMHCIAPDEYPVKSTWMDRYALQAWNAFGGIDVVGLRPDTRAEFYAVFNPRFRRMLKAVVLPQLPPKVRTVRQAELGTPARKMYDELDKQLHTRMPDGELFVASNRLVSRTRLMQFAAAAVKVNKVDPDDVSTWEVSLSEPSPKLDVLEEILEELGQQPFVVMAEYRDLVFMTAERLAKRGIRHGLIVGGQTSEENEQLTEELRKGNIQALVCTIKSGGVGLDMSGAGTIINLQRSWSLIDNIQAENRVHRIGSEIHASVNIIDVVTRDTLEEGQIDRLNDKLLMLDEITRDKSVLAGMLADTSIRSEDVEEIRVKISWLQEQERRVLANDDLDEMLALEEA